MPEVNTGNVTDKLRKALDAQGRQQAAARQAAQDATRPPEPPRPEPEPPEARK